MVLRSITVTAPDARRATVKVAPEDYMVDVLERVCKRLNLAPEKYLFRSSKSQVDLSISFGALNFPAGMVALTLVLKSVTPSAVSVALQLPTAEAATHAGKLPDGRLVHAFRSDTALWKVLRQFEDVVSREAGLANLNITGRGVAQMTSGSGVSGSGQVFWEAPVLMLLRREVSALADFQKTLAQLGYNSGRVLMRLSFRKTDKPLAQAMEEIQTLFREEGGGTTAPAEDKDDEKQEEEKSAVVPKGTGDPADQVSDGGGTAAPTTTKPPDVDGEPPMELDNKPALLSEPEPASTPPSTVPTEPFPSNPNAATIQRIAIYSPTSSTTIHAAQIQDPDSAFAPSIALAKTHQAHLLASTQNKRLPSDDEIAAQEAEKAARLARVTSVDVKVRFPDNWSADWRCAPSTTGARLYEAVREIMAFEAQPFQLVLPDRTVLRDVGGDDDRETLVKGYKLSGRVLVNFRWDDSVPEDIRKQAKQACLKESLRPQAQTVAVPVTPEPEQEEDVPKAAPKPAQQEGKKDDSGAKKVPKWMKLSKK